MSDFATNSQSDAAPGSATQPVESLSVAYRAAVKKYEQFENSSEEQGDETSFYDLLQQLEEVQERVDREGMISVNELVDDVSTGALQFLFLPYYYARVCSRCPVLSRRLHYLTVANGYLQRYVERCMKLHVVDEAEVATMVGAAEKPPSDADRRQQKIAKFKKERECKQRIEFLRQFIDDFAADSSGMDTEAEARELTLLQLQHYARTSADAAEMNTQEIAMLQVMAQEGPREEDGGSMDSRVRQRDRDNSDAEGRPLFRAPLPENRPGLSITRLDKVGDEIVMRRETVKGDVFRPHLPPPTMTLEEFADQEVRDALAREKAAKENPPSVTRRYIQLEGDGDEDNLDLVDQATLKDREWDQFKEDNPKGWGNKNKMG